MKNYLPKVLFVFVCLALFGLPVFGQVTNSGSILGSVADTKRDRWNHYQRPADYGPSFYFTRLARPGVDVAGYRDTGPSPILDRRRLAEGRPYHHAGRRPRSGRRAKVR